MYFYHLILNRKVKTITWEKDIHGLFDYDSKQLIIRRFKHSKSFRLFRDEVAVNVSEGERGSVGKLIASVGLIKGEYWVYDACDDKDKEPMLLVLKDYVHDGQSGIKLKLGDIIKMGKCKYLVKEMVRNREESTNVNSQNKTDEHTKGKANIETKSEIINVSTHNIKHSSNDNEMKCRVCLCFYNDNDNPIISLPCKCSGSVAFIHVTCLQEWLKSKIIGRKSQGCAQYSWKDFECDICKTLYPSIVSS
jgi:hypothetical protein